MGEQTPRCPLCGRKTKPGFRVRPQFIAALAMAIWKWLDEQDGES